MTVEKFVLAMFVACATAACAPAAKDAAGETPAAEQPDAQAPSVEEPAADAPAEDLCNSAQYQSFIGANAAAITLPADRPHRILGPNDAATMDYSPGRLNIMTDENGVIIEVKCG